MVDLAAIMRARHKLKAPDALQAACCLQHGADSDQRHEYIDGEAYAMTGVSRRHNLTQPADVSVG